MTGGPSIACRHRWPLVSIGLPVLNGERYLAEALDSILAQEFADYELIVADNASLDDTGKIAERYAALDPRIRYLRHERRHGAAFNFNFTARVSGGKYFKWAAHDDLSGPSLLVDCLDVLESDASAVLCYPRAVEIDAAGRVTRTFPVYRYAHEQRPSERVRSFLTQRPACLEVYGLMRLDTLRQTRLLGPFSSSDGVLLLELMLRGRFRRVERVGFYCRNHSERSLLKYKKSRRQWYDDAASSWRGFPEWRLTAELVKAIARAPVERGEKALGLLHVCAWATRMAPVLLRDLGGGLKAALEEVPLARGGRSDAG